MRLAADAVVDRVVADAFAARSRAEVFVGAAIAVVVETVARFRGRRSFRVANQLATDITRGRTSKTDAECRRVATCATARIPFIRTAIAVVIDAIAGLRRELLGIRAAGVRAARRCNEGHALNFAVGASALTASVADFVGRTAFRPGVAFVDQAVLVAIVVHTVTDLGHSLRQVRNRTAGDVAIQTQIVAFCLTRRTLRCPALAVCVETDTLSGGLLRVLRVHACCCQIRSLVRIAVDAVVIRRARNPRERVHRRIRIVVRIRIVGQRIFADVHPAQVVGVARETLIRADCVAGHVIRTSTGLRNRPFFGGRILTHLERKSLHTERTIHTGTSIAGVLGRISFRRSTRRERKCREATEEQCEITHDKLLKRNLLETVQHSGVRINSDSMAQFLVR